MIRTTDGGQNWTKVSPPFDDGRGSWAYIAWHALALAVNPDNPDKIYAGGLDLYTSDNATQSWFRVSSWYNFDNSAPEEPDYVHADHHTIRFRPGSSTDAIFTTDGGVFLTQNADASIPNFTEKNQGLNTLQYYTCAIHPAESKHHFLAGAQDNGTLFYKEAGVPVSVLSNVSYGDGTFCFIDENEPNLQLSSSQFNYIYSTENSISEGYMENTVNYFQGGIFNNPMDYDSKNNHLFSNGCDFFGNMADTLIRIINLNGVATRLFIPLKMGVTVPLTAIKVSPHTLETTTVLTGTQDGRLFKVENADYLKTNKNPPVVTEIGSNDFPASNIVCIDIGKNDDQILVIFSNFGVPSVWETRDGGQSWMNKEGELPDLPVRWGIYHPVNAKQVLLATEIGLWSCMNIMDDPVVWEPVADFPNVRVDMLKVRKSDNAVIAATHGRGLWYSPQFPLNVDQDIKIDSELKLYPNPTAGSLTISTGVFQKENLDLKIYSRAGKLMLEVPEFISNGNYSSEINLKNLKDGLYFIKLEGDSSEYTSRVVIRK
jgi:hypothetical protein